MLPEPEKTTIIRKIALEYADVRKRDSAIFVTSGKIYRISRSREECSCTVTLQKK
jgi:hypothetical protein